MVSSDKKAFGWKRFATSQNWSCDMCMWSPLPYSNPPNPTRWRCTLCHPNWCSPLDKISLKRSKIAKFCQTVIMPQYLYSGVLLTTTALMVEDENQSGIKGLLKGYSPAKSETLGTLLHPQGVKRIFQPKFVWYTPQIFSNDLDCEWLSRHILPI